MKFSPKFGEFETIFNSSRERYLFITEFSRDKEVISAYVAVNKSGGPVAKPGSSSQNSSECMKKECIILQANMDFWSPKVSLIQLLFESLSICLSAKS